MGSVVSELRTCFNGKSETSEEAFGEIDFANSRYSIEPCQSSRRMSSPLSILSLWRFFTSKCPAQAWPNRVGVICWSHIIILLSYSVPSIARQETIDGPTPPAFSRKKRQGDEDRSLLSIKALYPHLVPGLFCIACEVRCV